MTLTRRDLLTCRWSVGESAPVGVAPVLSLDASRCLAFCEVCRERCPVLGALVRVAGRMVVTPACNGCGACLAVCPSPFEPLRIVTREVTP
jgi:MinD superfamily P-loop ATPase